MRGTGAQRLPGEEPEHAEVEPGPHDLLRLPHVPVQADGPPLVAHSDPFETLFSH